MPQRSIQLRNDRLQPNFFWIKPNLNDIVSSFLFTLYQSMVIIQFVRYTSMFFSVFWLVSLFYYFILLRMRSLHFLSLHFLSLHFFCFFFVYPYNMSVIFWGTSFWYLIFFSRTLCLLDNTQTNNWAVLLVSVTNRSKQWHDKHWWS